MESFGRSKHNFSNWNFTVKKYITVLHNDRQTKTISILSRETNTKTMNKARWALSEFRGSES